MLENTVAARSEALIASAESACHAQNLQIRHMADELAAEAPKS